MTVEASGSREGIVAYPAEEALCTGPYLKEDRVIRLDTSRLDAFIRYQRVYQRTLARLRSIHAMSLR